MNRLINAKINVSKIDKTKLFKGTKGTYLDLAIWVNETPDQFGNDISIEQSVKKGEPKIYLGEGKFYVRQEKTEAPKEVTNQPDDLPWDN